MLVLKWDTTGRKPRGYWVVEAAPARSKAKQARARSK